MTKIDEIKSSMEGFGINFKSSKLNWLKSFEENDKTLIAKGRQVGLTKFLTSYCLAKMLEKNDLTILFVSWRQNSSNHVQNNFCNFIYKINNNDFFSGKNKIKYQTKNNLILFSTPDITKIKGYSFDIIIFDEMSFFKNDIKFYTMAMANLKPGGKIILGSNLSPSKSLFNELYRKNVKNNKEFKCFTNPNFKLFFNKINQKFFNFKFLLREFLCVLPATDN